MSIGASPHGLFASVYVLGNAPPAKPELKNPVVVDSARFLAPRLSSQQQRLAVEEHQSRNGRRKLPGEHRRFAPWPFPQRVCTGQCTASEIRARKPGRVL